MKKLKHILTLLLLAVGTLASRAEFGDIPVLTGEEKQHIAREMQQEEEGDVDVKETIFHHLGDGYGW